MTTAKTYRRLYFQLFHWWGCRVNLRACHAHLAGTSHPQWAPIARAPRAANNQFHRSPLSLTALTPSPPPLLTRARHPTLRAPPQTSPTSLHGVGSDFGRSNAGADDVQDTCYDELGGCMATQLRHRFGLFWAVLPRFLSPVQLTP